tara:strand:- start:14002 stop:14883 length:882 start_codon:yes stop_codon:yes gene_type:complete
MLKKIHPQKKIIFEYLLIGSNGLLGSSIKSKLNLKKVMCVARTNSDYNLDLKYFKKFKKIFDKYQFKNVINCAAITNLSQCEREKKKSKKINLELPILLNNLSKKMKFNLIHISTDQVYCKSKSYKFKETDKISFLNYYSKTKFLAEKILMNNKKSLIIRTNFTGFKKNLNKTFVGWLLDNIKRKKKINLFNDFYVSTIDVNFCSSVIIKLIKKKAKGIYNLGSRKSISKEKFAILFAEKLGKKLNYNSISSTKSNIIRPKNLTMDTSKIERKLKILMPYPVAVVNNLIKELN